MEKQVKYIQVEEFLMEELVIGEEGSAEQKQERRAELLDKLHLKEQKKMFAEDVGIPYQRLTKAGVAIWSAFCPHRCKLADFKGYIPTRVLEIIDTMQEKFNRIEVWSEEQTNPDPVLVGIAGGEYASGQIHYLLARWGASLLSYVDVVKVAREKWVSRRRNKLTAKLTQAEKDLASLEHDADAYFDGEFVSEIY